MTHAELSKELGVSRSYVSRLVRAGMPTTSPEDARGWISKRADEAGTGGSAPRSLNEARMEKVLLECEILQIRLEREREGAEYVKTDLLIRGIETFLAFARMSATMSAQRFAERMSAAGTPQQACELLRQFGAESYIDGVAAWIANSDLHPQIKAAIGEPLKAWPQKWTDAQIERCVARLTEAQVALGNHYQLPATP